LVSFWLVKRSIIFFVRGVAPPGISGDVAVEMRHHRNQKVMAGNEATYQPPPREPVQRNLASLGLSDPFQFLHRKEGLKVNQTLQRKRLRDGMPVCSLL